MKNTRRAWLVCIGCTLLLLCTIGLANSAFSIYQPYLISKEGLSNGQASTVITVRNMFSLLAMLSVTYFYRKFSLRSGVVISAIAIALSFGIFGLAHTFTMNCVAAAVAGLAYGYGGMIPVSLLIQRWFHDHQALALGICAAGSGIATIVAPPLVTLAIEHLSLQAAFWMEGVVVLVAAALIFLLVRNAPAEGESQPVAEAEQIQDTSKSHESVMTRGETVGVLAAIMMLGTIANPGMAHLAVLYRSIGVDDTSVSLLLSLLGAALTIGKCLYGHFTDRVGAKNSGWIFFGLMILGQGLCCFGAKSLPSVNTAAMLLFGVGLPLATVGLTVFARDLSTPEQYAATIRQFQLAYMAGSLLFGPVPGFLADTTGSYFPTYRLLTVFAVISMLLMETVYYRVEGRSRKVAHRLERRAA